MCSLPGASSHRPSSPYIQFTRELPRRKRGMQVNCLRAGQQWGFASLHGPSTWALGLKAPCQPTEEQWTKRTHSRSYLIPNLFSIAFDFILSSTGVFEAVLGCFFGFRETGLLCFLILRRERPIPSKPNQDHLQKFRCLDSIFLGCSRGQRFAPG